MARKAKRAVPLPRTVEELQQLTGIRHCWKSLTGILLHLEHGGETNVRGHTLFRLVLVDWAVTKTDFCSGSLWDIPKLQDSGAVYVGNVLGMEDE